VINSKDLPLEFAIGGARPLCGTLRIPGDKSISHRAFMFAALAEGESTIRNIATGDDVWATARVLESLGVKLRGVSFEDPMSVLVGGRGVSAFTEADDVLECHNSGTTMRVLAGVLAGCPFLSLLTGDMSLRSRPMGRVIEPLRAMGAYIDGREGGTRAPLIVRGGDLHGLRWQLPVATAQVKTAILLAGLQADGETEVVSPGPSRDHTERMLSALGAPITVDDLSVRVVRGAPQPFEIEVPGDPSSAAFFAVAAAITPGSDLILESVSCNPTRIGFVTVMKRMGADIELTQTGETCGEPYGDLRVRASRLHGTTVEGDEIPNVIDEIPALAVAAAFADGVTEIRDAAELVVKESNRIATLEEELGKLGVGVEGRSDGLVIRGGNAQAGEFDSHADHRIAMAFAVAANALPAESTLRRWPAIASSYPEFGRDLELLTGSSGA